MDLPLSNIIISQLNAIDDKVTTEAIKSLANELHLHEACEPQRKAAVLIPLIQREHELTILLTQRTHDLPYHAGQISFPGGKTEDGDMSLEMTALRETYEETGLKDISLLTQLGTYTSYSGFEISTLVGLVNQPEMINPNPEEVAKIIEVPLPVIMDRNQFTLESIEKESNKRYFYQLLYQENVVWGFTGSILYLFGQYLHTLDL